MAEESGKPMMPKRSEYDDPSIVTSTEYLRSLGRGVGVPDTAGNFVESAFGNNYVGGQYEHHPSFGEELERAKREVDSKHKWWPKFPRDVLSYLTAKVRHALPNTYGANGTDGYSAESVYSMQKNHQV